MTDINEIGDCTRLLEMNGTLGFRICLSFAIDIIMVPIRLFYSVYLSVGENVLVLNLNVCSKTI